MNVFIGHLVWKKPSQTMFAVRQVVLNVKIDCTVQLIEWKGSIEPEASIAIVINGSSEARDIII